MTQKITRFFHRTVASLFFIGHLPGMPGTFASAATVGVMWFFRGELNDMHSITFWLCTLVLIILSIIFSSRSKELFGTEDSGKIVIDECAGQFLAFLFVPLTWKSLLVGLILFRIFDIVKPFPAYKMEELEGGLGITMDDVIAGVYANISLLFIVNGYHVVRAHL